MRKLAWVLGSLGLVLVSSTQAEATLVLCPNSIAMDDREFGVNTTPPATCLTYGTGNISGNNDPINNFGTGWITLDKSDDNTTGALQGVLTITGQGTKKGTFTIDPLAWATYNNLVIAFKSGQGQLDPDWAAFTLPFGVLSGTWKIYGSQTLSHANLYGNDDLPLPPIPEPGTLLLLGAGLGTLASRTRYRRA